MTEIDCFPKFISFFSTKPLQVKRTLALDQTEELFSFLPRFAFLPEQPSHYPVIGRFSPASSENRRNTRPAVLPDLIEGAWDEGIHSGVGIVAFLLTRHPHPD